MEYKGEVVKILFSALMGCLVGLEREIRRKPAGFRTLALISVGSTVFTICSSKLGFPSNADRIAANIITGVGFLGAGVIFRNGSSVSGITTAATIWIAAALGMLAGIGEYALATLTLGLSLIILYALQFLQNYIDSRFQHRNYTVSYKAGYAYSKIEAQLKQLNLTVRSFKETRQNTQLNFEFELSGKLADLDQFNQWLKDDSDVLSFTW